MKIYKYQIVDNKIEAPAGSQLLTCQHQHDQLCIWALVNPEVTETNTWDIQIVGTGQDFDSVGWSYLSTVQESIFVWHIWYRNYHDY